MNVIDLVQKNGPDKEEFKSFDNLINSLDNKSEGEAFRKSLGDVLKKEHTLFGHTFEKPFGYAGDFHLIEKIYEKYSTDDPKYKKWDMFYHSHEATDAVRNRKSYFIQKMSELVTSKSDLNVLILGSGPATDVNEFLKKNPSANVSFLLLDIDQNAIDYASEKNAEFADKISFIKANVKKYRTEQKFDLIWSAGLFDYLNDDFFTYLLNVYKDNIKEDGKIIIGNFSPSNPTIKVMEVMTEWYLNYRDEDHLIQLAEKAGIEKSRCIVEKEPLGINLFLKINA